MGKVSSWFSETLPPLHPGFEDSRETSMSQHHVTTAKPKARWGTFSLSLKQREAVLGYLFLLPYTALFLIFLAGPTISAIQYSFLEWELLRGTKEYIGLDNFKLMLEDDLFWTSLENSLRFAATTTFGNVIVALAAAMALKHIRFGTVYRVALYAPVVLSISVISIIFQRMLSVNGLLNYGLSLIGIKEINYLGDPSLVLTSLSITTIWWGFGFPMLIFLAALYAVPEHLYEAAKIDGANSRVLLVRVTLPLIRPALLFVIVTQFIGHTQVFGQSFIITQGGPGYASYTIVLHIYRNAWRYYHMGYAAAMSLTLALIMFVFALVQFRLLGQRVEY